MRGKKLSFASKNGSVAWLCNIFGIRAPKSPVSGLEVPVSSAGLGSLIGCLAPYGGSSK